MDHISPKIINSLSEEDRAEIIKSNTRGRLLQLMKGTTQQTPAKEDWLEKKLALKNSNVSFMEYLEGLAADGLVQTIRHRSMEGHTNWHWLTKAGEKFADGFVPEIEPVPEPTPVQELIQEKPNMVATTRAGILTPREFTASDKSLIQKVHGFMTAEQLLKLLNDRLLADVGNTIPPYTMEQLYKETDGTGKAIPKGGHDWGTLRKLLNKARQDGILGKINEQVINDFAIVFSLNPRQVLVLKDSLLQKDE